MTNITPEESYSQLSDTALLAALGSATCDWSTLDQAATMIFMRVIGSHHHLVHLHDEIDFRSRVGFVISVARSYAAGDKCLKRRINRLESALGNARRERNDLTHATWMQRDIPPTPGVAFAFKGPKEPVEYDANRIIAMGRRWRDVAGDMFELMFNPASPFPWRDK